jgi:hypothetical protein
VCTIAICAGEERMKCMSTCRERTNKRIENVQKRQEGGREEESEGSEEEISREQKRMWNLGRVAYKPEGTRRMMKGTESENIAICGHGMKT